jgi:preprotein translocase subunit SecG
MSDISAPKAKLTGKQIAAIVIATVYAFLNVVAVSNWLIGGGQIFYVGEFITSLANLMWFLAPFGYIAAGIFILAKKPIIGFWLILVPAMSVLTNIASGLINGYAESVLPIISFKFFSPEYWAVSVISGTELFAVIAMAILLFPKKQTRGVSTMSTNSPINKSNFCPSCGSPAGDGDFCSKCGTNLGNSSSTNTSNGVFSGTATTSTMAVVAFILSFFVPIVGLILGYISRKDIDQSGGRLSGRGLATAAIVLNWIWIAFIVIWIIGAVSFAAQY